MSKEAKNKPPDRIVSADHSLSNGKGRDRTSEFHYDYVKLVIAAVIYFKSSESQR
jgi:hypothetical protein